VYVIDGIKRQLHQQVQSTFDHIARLTEAKQQLIRVRIISILKILFSIELNTGSPR
jgi:hypothetical protein